MKLRTLYVRILRLHPPAFRRRFAEEILWVFDEIAPRRSVTPLFADALRSLCRQWLLRPIWEQPIQAARAAGGAPAFLSLENHGVRRGALFEGALISVLAFAGVFYSATRGAGHWEGIERVFYSLESSAVEPGEAPPARSGLPAHELASDEVETLVRRLMMLDLNHDGRISKSERRGPLAAQYRDLLERADINHDGYVTEDELRLEIERRAR